MSHSRTLRMSLILANALALIVVGITLAFSNQWSTHFDGGNGDLNQWSKYLIGNCSGQQHNVSNSQVHMLANYGTKCFGAFYRDNNGKPGTFPTDKDIRVMWQWRYPQYAKYGTQAGQVTSAFGVVQYYGMSAVDTKSVGGNTRDAHVLTDGEWGRNTVDNPLWRSPDSDRNWHVSTFDFICDGRELTWWVDSSQIKRITNGTPRGPGDPYRPFQFWYGNLITSVPSSGGWTSHDLEYVYIYAVERPTMSTPSTGSGGSQPVSWNGVPNTPQPNGAMWGIEYQTQVCSNSNCSTALQTANWQSGTTYTFTGLPLQQTYYYRVRAKWVGTPELVTCWSPTVSALMSGTPDVDISKTAPASVVVGSTIQYNLIFRSTGQVPANGVVVRDPVPQYVTSPTNISNGGTLQGNQIVWNLGTVANGQSVNLSWQGTIDPNTPTSVTQIVNTATAQDNAGHSAQAQATTAVLKPIMELSKSATASVSPGGTVVYTITIRSTGNSALTNVVVRDPIPQYVTNPTKISNGGSVQNNTIVWNLPDIPPSQSVTLSWQGTVATTIPRTETQIINRVTATAGGGISKEAEARTDVGYPQIGVAKTAPAEIAAGQTIDYVIAVHNIGNGAANNVVIRDPVPQYVMDPTNISNGGVLQNNEIIWTIPTLGAGQSVSVSWQGTIDPEIPLTQNQIVNTVTACDATNSCDTAVATTRILKPAVSLTKNATSHVYPHGRVDYEIIVENSGETILKDIVVKDPLPQYVLNPQEISHDGIADASPFEGKIEIVWRLPDMAPGQVVVLSWHGTVDPATPDSEFAIRNVATITTKEVNAEAEASSYVLHARLFLRKSATVMAGPGDSVLYTLTIENHSWAPAYGVEVHDPIPQYIINQRNANEGGEVRAEEILWRFGILNPGEKRTLMWEGTVDPTIPAAVKQIANTATAFDGMGHRDEATAYTNLPAQVLYTYKTASYIVWPGGEIEYGVVVQNFNQATLQQVVVRDPVPNFITYPRDISHNGVFEGNMEVVWHIDSIAPGESILLIWKGTVDPSMPRTQDVLWNEATITSSGGLTGTAKAKSYVDFPLINLYKVATPKAGPGEVISYTLMAENPTNVPALNVVVRDLIPADVTNPVNISEGGVIENIPSNQIVWNIATLNPGERRLLGWEGTVDLALPASTSQISNTIDARDLSGLNIQAQASTTVLRPSLGFTKSAPAEVLPGENVNYTLTVSNTGQMKLRQVTIVDPLPPYVLNPTNISQGGVISGNQVVWNLGDLLPGAKLDLSWQGTLDAATPVNLDTLTNAAVASAWPGMQMVAVADSTIIKPNLLVVKHAPDGVRPGDIIDYRIDVVNQGRTTVRQLEVTDPITHYLSPYRINDGGYEMPGNYITWGQVGDLAPGQSRTFSWQAKLDPNLPRNITAVRNVAQVKGLGGLNIEAEAVSPVLESGLLLNKEAISSTYAGGEISYVLHVINQGPGLARDVEVQDPIPGFVKYVPGSVNNYGQVDETQIVWRFDQLQPGEAVELTWRGQVAVDIPSEVGAIINEARAMSLDAPSPVTAMASTAILPPVLEVQQTCAPFAQVGDKVAYQLHLINSGAGTLFDVMAQETIPAGLSEISNSIGAGGQLNGDKILWNVGTMASGAVADLTFELQIPPGLSEDEITNRVDFYSAGKAINQSSCPTELTTPVLSVAKVAPATAKVNETVEYTIVVSNTGPVVAHQTVISDALQPGVEYIPGTISDGGQVSGTTLVWQLGDLPVGQSMTRRFKAQVYIPGEFNDFTEDGEARIYNEAIASAYLAALARDEAVILVPRPVLTLTRTSLTNSEKTGTMAVYATQTGGDGPTVSMAKLELANASSDTSNQLSLSIASADPAAQASVAVENGQVVPAIQVYPGDSITYTLVGANNGPGVARQAVLKERVPDGLVVLENTISHNGFYKADERTIIWALGDLAEGQQIQRTYSALVPQGMRPDLAEIDDNLAFISSPDAPTVYANASTEITGTFQMSGIKTATAYAQPGGKIDYAIKVQNTSPHLLDHIVIRDPLPDYTTYVDKSASLPPAFEDGGRTLVWNLGAMAAGEVREVRFSIQVAARVPDMFGRILNKAKISFTGGNTFEVQASTTLPAAQITPAPTPRPSAGSSGGITPAGNPPPAATSIPARPPVAALPIVPTASPTAPPPGPTPLPVPALVKSVSPAVVKAGQTTAVTWRLTFTNPTPLTIGGLTIRDVLPEGVTYISGSTSLGAITVNQIPLSPGSGMPSTASPSSSQASNPLSATSTASPTLMVLPTPRVMPQNAAQIPLPTQTTNLSRAASLTEVLQLASPTPLAPIGNLAQTSALSTIVTMSQPTLVEQSLSPAWTMLTINVGDVAPGSRVEILIQTMVVSPTAGMEYLNTATYSALNLDPGSSNEARVTVEATAMTILPVTGGWLDPRTPEGKVTWSAVTLLLLSLIMWGWYYRKRLALRAVHIEGDPSHSID
ncbi:MAG: hypothetical protein BroJett011_59290 [Chloroflexota bacterium]|nr:MAG: hypothetical protein BroJett011_59290 [Chloroflexota bacterium]